LSSDARGRVFEVDESTLIGNWAFSSPTWTTPLRWPTSLPGRRSAGMSLECSTALLCLPIGAVQPTSRI